MTVISRATARTVLVDAIRNLIEVEEGLDGDGYAMYMRISGWVLSGNHDDTICALMAGIDQSLSWDKKHLPWTKRTLQAQIRTLVMDDR